MGTWGGEGGEGEREVSLTLVAHVNGSRGSEYGVTDL